MWIDILFHLNLFFMFGLVLFFAHAGLRQKPVPNSLFLLLLLLYPIAVLTSPVEVAWPLAIVSALPTLIIGYCLFAVGFMGANDAKLISVLGIWAGPVGLFGFLAITLTVGMFWAFLVFSKEGVKQSVEGTGFARGFRFALRSRTYLQLGPAIAVGALGILLSYEQIINLSL